MVQRKDSMGYADILRGKFNVHNNFHLNNILNELTHNEYKKYMRERLQNTLINLWEIDNEEELKN